MLRAKSDFKFNHDPVNECLARSDSQLVGSEGREIAVDVGITHLRERSRFPARLLVAIELCSLTFQHGEASRRNLVATSLFSDGAAAAVIAGAQAAIPERPHPALALLASRSTLWPDSLDVMGWEVDEAGLHVVFSRDIPSIVRDWVRPDFESFLADHDLDLAGLDAVIAHPGGPKVLLAYQQALGLPHAALRHSAEILRTCGNMSSPTCLFVLERALAAGDIKAGDSAVLAALGPGFSSELVLMRGV